MIQKKSRKNKKALSVMVGYVLLVVFSTVLGVIVYAILKTYVVPKPEVNYCPEGTSLLIEGYNYDCGDENNLTFYITNNGRFDIEGYFIYGKDDPDKEKATLVLSSNNTDSLSKIGELEIKLGNPNDINDFSPGDTEKEEYNFTGTANQIYLIEIVPIRMQTEERKTKLVSCTDARIIKTIDCTP